MSANASLNAAETAYAVPASAIFVANERPASRAIDWNRVAAYLADQGQTLDRSFAPRQLLGGLANINLLLRIDDAWAVLRRPPAGDLPPGAHDMAREHHVLSGLKGQLDIAPRSLHFCADPTVAGAPFQLLAFHEGRTVRGADIAPLPPTAATGARVSEVLVDTLARIHAVDMRSAGLENLGRAEGFLARTAEGWLRRGELAHPAGLPASGRFVAEWLSGAKWIDTTAPTLLHNDFKLDNIILANDVIAPLVVIDWDMATRGDPLFDLAALLSYWAEAGDPDCMARLAQMPSARPGFMTREHVAQAYAARTGRSLEGFASVRVLALFRLAVVFRQLRNSYAIEDRSDPRVAHFETLAHDLFDFAADVVRGKMF